VSAFLACQKLGVPFSAAKSAEELSDYDWFVATAMSEAERLVQVAKQKAQT
jgi:hypothetical protein